MMVPRAGVLVPVLVHLAMGHGQLMVPVPRPDPVGQAVRHTQREPVYTLNGPTSISLTYTETAFRCHDFGTFSAITPLTAGQPFEVSWMCEACHPGDCYLYVSYDESKAAPENWFKIAAFPGCGAVGTINPPGSTSWQVVLPPELPACDHCVLRWEWTAHQQPTNIEFYVQCTDISIASSAGPTKPSPTVQISGIEHLPASRDAYRDPYNGEGPGEEFLLDPKIASYTSCAAGSAGCISGSGTGPVVTPAPTPTPAPGETPSPTSSPAGSQSQDVGGYDCTWTEPADAEVQWRKMNEKEGRICWEVSVPNSNTLVHYQAKVDIYHMWNADVCCASASPTYGSDPDGAANVVTFTPKDNLVSFGFCECTAWDPERPDVSCAGMATANNMLCPVLGNAVFASTTCSDAAATIDARPASCPSDGGQSPGGEVDSGDKEDVPVYTAPTVYLAQVEFNGDYREVVGSSYKDFLDSCTAELSEVTCTDVGIGEGSIFVTVSSGDQAYLNSALQQLTTQGLSSHPLLEYKGLELEPDNKQISEDPEDEEDGLPIWVVLAAVAGVVVVLGTMATVSVFLYFRYTRGPRGGGPTSQVVGQNAKREGGVTAPPANNLHVLQI